MLTMVIVDDEEDTLNGLIEVVDWPRLGVQVTGRAQNGQQALEVIRQVRPDIVLMDIRMPVMSGIECARRMKDEGLECAVVFVSSYSDKEYLLSAIDLNVAGYIEKPIDIAVAERAVKKAARICAYRRSLSQSEKSLSETGRLILSDVVRQITLGGYSQAFDEVLNRCVGTFVPDRKASCLVFKFRHPRDTFEGGQAVIARIMDAADEVFLFAVPDTSMACAVVCPPRNSMSEVIELGAAAIEELTAEFGEGFAAGAGRLVADFRELHESYLDALGKVSCAFIRGYGRLFYAGSAGGDPSLGESLAIIAQKFELLLGGDNEEALHELLQSARELLSLGSGPEAAEFGRQFYARLYAAMTRRARMADTADGDGPAGALQELLNRGTLRETHRFMAALVDKHFSLGKELAGKSPKIRRAIRYIRAHYRHSLSLEAVADEAGLTQAYLCSLFKHETGLTITAYAEQLKIARAKELLKKGKYNLSTVAEMAGYNSLSYFTRAFRKSTGLRPADYAAKAQTHGLD